MITRHKLKDMGLNLETLTIMSMPNMTNISPFNHHHTNSNLNLCGSKRRGGQELLATTPPVSNQFVL